MISILFVAKNSVYKTMTDSTGESLDCWDEERDALNWSGGNPIVAHPPCRLWSRWLRHLSSAPVSEKELARFAVEQVRKFGGVLEHPACSLLWEECSLPVPGKRDEFGLSISVRQQWFGHKAEKATWLYVCWCTQLPDIPFCLGDPLVRGHWGHPSVKHPNLHRLSEHERQATPPAFARWLVETAERCVTPEARQSPGTVFPR